jgi:hypothetical protein
MSGWLFPSNPSDPPFYQDCASLYQNCVMKLVDCQAKIEATRMNQRIVIDLFLTKIMKGGDQ